MRVSRAMKIKVNPSEVVRKSLVRINKIVYYPLKYKQGKGYDAEAYWRDRLRKYGMGFRGVGNEGLDEERNRIEYERSIRDFQLALLQAGIDLEGKRVLEIGVGNGFYTEFCAKDADFYCAVDITDVLFPELSKRFPHVTFVKADVRNLRLEWEFDVILMIEVLQHIVNEKDLASAMVSIKYCLAKGGTLIIGPVQKKGKKHLFNVHFWGLDSIARYFEGYRIDEYLPFRGGSLLFIRNLELQ